MKGGYESTGFSQAAVDGPYGAFFKGPVWGEIMADAFGKAGLVPWDRDVYPKGRKTFEGRAKFVREETYDWGLWRMAADYARDLPLEADPEPLAEALEFFALGNYLPTKWVTGKCVGTGLEYSTYGWKSPVYYRRGAGGKPSKVAVRSRHYMLPLPLFNNLHPAKERPDSGVLGWCGRYFCRGERHGLPAGPITYYNDVTYGDTLNPLWQTTLLAYVRLVTSFVGGAYVPYANRSPLIRACHDCHRVLRRMQAPGTTDWFESEWYVGTDDNPRLVRFSREYPGFAPGRSYMAYVV